jgi:hypothetical protein
MARTRISSIELTALFVERLKQFSECPDGIFDCDSPERRQRIRLGCSNEFGAADAASALRETNSGDRKTASRDLRPG